MLAVWFFVGGVACLLLVLLALPALKARRAKSKGENLTAERTINKDWIILELKQSLRALAAPGAAALASQPDGVAKADELALEFDNFLGPALGSMGGEFTEEQRTALRKVDAQLSRMSGQDQSELWTDEAVLRHPAWEEVRKLATEALQALGWEGPPMTWEEYRRSIKNRE